MILHAAQKTIAHYYDRSILKLRVSAVDRQHFIVLLLPRESFVSAE